MSAKQPNIHDLSFMDKSFSIQDFLTHFVADAEKIKQNLATEVEKIEVSRFTEALKLMLEIYSTTNIISISNQLRKEDASAKALLDIILKEKNIDQISDPVEKAKLEKLCRKECVKRLPDSIWKVFFLLDNGKSIGKVPAGDLPSIEIETDSDSEFGLLMIDYFTTLSAKIKNLSGIRFIPLSYDKIKRNINYYFIKPSVETYNAYQVEKAMRAAPSAEAISSSPESKESSELKSIREEEGSHSKPAEELKMQSEFSTIIEEIETLLSITETLLSPKAKPSPMLTRRVSTEIPEQWGWFGNAISRVAGAVSGAVGAIGSAVGGIIGNAMNFISPDISKEKLVEKAEKGIEKGVEKEKSSDIKESKEQSESILELQRKYADFKKNVHAFLLSAPKALGKETVENLLSSHIALLSSLEINGASINSTEIARNVNLIFAKLDLQKYVMDKLLNPKTDALIALLAISNDQNEFDLEKFKQSAKELLGLKKICQTLNMPHKKLEDELPSFIVKLKGTLSLSSTFTEPSDIQRLVQLPKRLAALEILCKDLNITIPKEGQANLASFKQEIANSIANCFSVLSDSIDKNSEDLSGKPFKQHQAAINQFKDILKALNKLEFYKLPPEFKPANFDFDANMMNVITKLRIYSKKIEDQGNALFEAHSTLFHGTLIKELYSKTPGKDRILSLQLSKRKAEIDFLQTLIDELSKDNKMDSRFRGNDIGGQLHKMNPSDKLKILKGAIDYFKQTLKPSATTIGIKRFKDMLQSLENEFTFIDAEQDKENARKELIKFINSKPRSEVFKNNPYFAKIRGDVTHKVSSASPIITSYKRPQKPPHPSDKPSPKPPTPSSSPSSDRY